MLVYTGVARLRGTVRVKCLDQERNTMFWPGSEPKLLDLGTSALGRRPSHLPLLTMRMIVKFIIETKSSSIPGTMLPCWMFEWKWSLQSLVCWHDSNTYFVHITQRVGEWIFSGKIHVNYRYHRYQPMKHSYDKIIAFSIFHLIKSYDWHTDTW